jgi:hypothetical protein
MFKALNTFLGILAFLLILRWLLPPEIGDLAAQILIQILTIVRDLIGQIKPN